MQVAATFCKVVGRRMTTQFIVPANTRNFRTLQILPSVFTYEMYTGSRWLYLIHNKCTMHKVFIKKVPGNLYALFSDEWKQFVDESRYRNVAMLHFIRQGEDMYYVTAYDNAGAEVGGYKNADVGTRKRRCFGMLGRLDQSDLIPQQFMPQIKRVRVMVSGWLAATVTQNRIALPGNTHGYVFSGVGWDLLVFLEGLKVGSRMVFTEIGEGTVSMISFADDGLGMRLENIPRVILNDEKPFKKSCIDKDPRMKHKCDWFNHSDHDDEVDCFYQDVVAYVTGRGRLTIPWDFAGPYEMYKYHNAVLIHDDETFYVNVDWEKHKDRPDSKNHVTIKTNWKDVEKRCEWDKDKTVRFKLIRMVKDENQIVNVRMPVMIPLFHMC